MALIFFALISAFSNANAEVAFQKQDQIRTHAMAPLFVGSLEQVNPRDTAWEEFRAQVRRARQLGITGITVDVWWGWVQRRGLKTFDWSYYDLIFSILESEGMRIIPILSTHACGGNVGDTVNIPLPQEFREIMPRMAGGHDGRFRSESGQWSNEVIGAWVDPTPYYRVFWEAFRDRYQDRAALMPNLVVSLGPSSELTYPSYHRHDGDYQVNGEHVARFPHRGALQASSKLARQSFYDWLIEKYGSLEAVNRAWGQSYGDYWQIDFFVDSHKVSQFFARGEDLSAQGQDFFDWYHGSLIQSGHRVMDAFVETFGRGAFSRSSVSHKSPGIFWSFKDRRALLTSGQITTRGAEAGRFPASWSPSGGLGFDSLFSNFMLELRLRHPQTDFVSVLTCGEQANHCLNHEPGPGRDWGEKNLAAHDVVKAFRLLSLEQVYDRGEGPEVMALGLENSIEDHLFNPFSIERLEGHALGSPNVMDVTFLRVGTVVQPIGRLHESIRRLNEAPRPRVIRKEHCEGLLGHLGS